MIKIGNAIIHERSYIERLFRISNVIGIANVWISLAGICLFLFFVYRYFDTYNRQVSIFIPVVHFALFLFQFVLFFAAAFDRISDVKSKTLGSYKHKRVMKLVDEVLHDNFHEGQEIPNVYIINNIGNNAFAVNSLLMNFIKKLNSITLSKNLFDMLSIPELKSVMAHEIGHFKRNIYIPDRIRFIPQLFLVLSAYMVIVHLDPLAGSNAVVAYLFVFVILKRIWTSPFRLFQQDIEYLSDLYAAEKYGKLAFVNAMIKIHQMNDLDLRVNYEVARRILDSENLPLNEFSIIAGRIKKRVGKRLYDQEYIAHQVVGAFNSLDGKKRAPLVKLEKLKRNRALKQYVHKLSKIMDDKIVDWNEIDAHERDGRIDSEEYEGLIDILKHYPELKLFKSSFENIGRKRFGSHPALRRRILFVDRNCRNL